MVSGLDLGQALGTASPLMAERLLLEEKSSIGSCRMWISPDPQETCASNFAEEAMHIYPRFDPIAPCMFAGQGTGSFALKDHQTTTSARLMSSDSVDGSTGAEIALDTVVTAPVGTSG